MATLQNEFFRSLFSTYPCDKAATEFLTYVQDWLDVEEDFRGPGALTPKACVIACVAYGGRMRAPPSEFRFVADLLNPSRLKDVDNLFVTARAPLASSDSAPMTEDMVAIIADTQVLARKTTGNNAAPIAPRHLVGALLGWLRDRGSTEEKAYYSALGLDLDRLLPHFVLFVIDEMKHPDSKREWENHFVIVPPPKAETGSGTQSTRPQKITLPDRLTVGSKFRMDRIAQEDELALRVDDYAGILSDFFVETKSSGEVCFALYGHWGRGKSFLMSRAAQMLRSKSYATVTFSAWKYPNAPEVWVHLYETVADYACKAKMLAKLPSIVRTGIAKHGTWPLLSALTAFTAGMLPKTFVAIKAIQWLDILFKMIGVGGIIWLASLLLGISKTSKRLSHDFLTATSHAEKLGLQATIGKDLKALLIGWMPHGTRPPVPASVYYFALALLFTWCAWHWLGFAPLHLAPHPNVRLAVTATVAAFTVAIYAWIFSSRGRLERVLLIVDDLDRCEPTQLLSVMESIKLLLDDDEINKRVQVAMLIEEQVLDNALSIKYGGLNMNRDRMLRENKEKLFNVHMRMGQLSDSDIRELLEKLVAKGRQKRIAGAQARLLQIAKELQSHGTTQVTLQGEEPPPVAFPEPTKTVPMSPEDEADRRSGLAREREKINTMLQKTSWTSSQEASAKTYKNAGHNVSNSEFDADEEDAFWKCIPRLRFGERGLTFGPRSIRAFVLRYQLARLLATRLGVRWTPKELVEELCARISSDDTKRPESENAGLQQIVAQVC